MSLHQARSPAWRALERVGVAACAHMPTERLSNSERIRVGLAQALVREPRILLVDEPAVLLRPSEGVQLYELLHSLGRDLRLAIMIASQSRPILTHGVCSRSVAAVRGRRMSPQRSSSFLTANSPRWRRTQP